MGQSVMNAEDSIDMIFPLDILPEPCYYGSTNAIESSYGALFDSLFRDEIGWLQLMTRRIGY